ncbi:MAG: hypothetical protein EBU90_16785 [Proteobacteria bacterium]|nr:hypothetical protein [Pseudomonadota bacterium]
MKKVALYGHLIIDHIFIDFKSTTSIGGIANVWNGLVQIDSSLEVVLVPSAFGEAVVVVSPESNTRVGRANFNLKTTKPSPIQANWHHIAYLNQLQDVSLLGDITSGIVSADLTKESPEKILKELRFVDFLFLSKEDLFMDLVELGKHTKGWVIAHDPLGSVCSNGTEVIQYDIPSELMLHKINVLGAGDMFAACFISNTLMGLPLKKALANSHEQTATLLKANII